METHRSRPPFMPLPSRTGRVVFVVCGLLCLGAGAAGVLLPVVPTTPFVLAATWFFARSSARLHRWLFHNRFFGPLLLRYYEGRGISLATKAVAICAVIVSMGASAIWAVPADLVWAKIAMAAVGVAVCTHIARIGHGTKKRNGESNEP